VLSNIKEDIEPSSIILFAVDLSICCILLHFKLFSNDRFQHLICVGKLSVAC